MEISRRYFSDYSCLMTKLKLVLFLLLFILVPAAGAQAQSVSSKTLLNKLAVGSENGSGYDRDLFKHWIDADSNRCDTRQEVLLRQNSQRSKTCGAETGTWFSSYDGLRFTRSGDLDVDHMVPLAEAWGSGAWNWSALQRQSFANDLYGYSLLAVSASSNRSKSDRDPAEWMPGRDLCRYVAQWVAVKYRWKLAIDTREKGSIARTMRGCGASLLSVNRFARANVQPAKPPVIGPPPTGLDPRFPSCTAAKAAGFGPYYRDVDVEYSWYRDGDNDGTVCE